MAPKTAQLQIRISPAQKAALKRLAAAERLSLSEFVLRKALEAAPTPLTSWSAIVKSGVALPNSLSDLELELRTLDEASFSEAVDAFDTADLSELQANCVAAAVEREASRRGVSPPPWTEAVLPMGRPWFAWRLRSLRPHLMRISPAAYKRRGVYLPAAGDPRR